LPVSALLVVLIAAGEGSSLAQATRCQWRPAVQVGALDAGVIDEASGLAVSGAFPDRLYHVNDSGDSGRFFVTTVEGGETRIVNVGGFNPRDAEDLTLGPCGSAEGNCLFIGDIGDNSRVRDDLSIVVVREEQSFADVVDPVAAVRIRYPDGRHDAESLAIHPNGDLYIVTKSADYSLLEVSPSRIYRLPLARRLNAGADVQLLDLVGEIDFPVLSSDTFSGSLPTALDISADGTRFIVLTYVNAFEFYLDVSSGGIPLTAELVEGRDFREISLDALLQQESIAYLEVGAFLYETEAVDRTARIMRVRCEAVP
jgi:hypothetical protein